MRREGPDGEQTCSAVNGCFDLSLVLDRWLFSSFSFVQFQVKPGGTSTDSRAGTPQAKRLRCQREMARRTDQAALDVAMRRYRSLSTTNTGTRLAVQA